MTLRLAETSSAQFMRRVGIVDDFAGAVCPACVQAGRERHPLRTGLPLEDTDLVAQGEDLRILVAIAGRQQPQDSEVLFCRAAQVRRASRGGQVRGVAVKRVPWTRCAERLPGWRDVRQAVSRYVWIILRGRTSWRRRGEGLIREAGTPSSSSAR